MPLEPIAKPSSVNFTAPFHISHVTGNLKDRVEVY